MDVGVEMNETFEGGPTPIKGVDQSIGMPLTALTVVDELVARTFRMPRSALHAGTRCRKTVAFARQVAMYLGHVCLSYPLKDVAEHYCRDRTTVAYACGVVEDRREKEETELLLNSLESALETMMLLTPLTCKRSS
ncbi:helix-turn-helix domain-containing protein [Cohaesibacter celericrescens]|uniref:Chromosomal replication initiator DnaA n=1 Tax=Cohaesibacter celericrescens TaxID=2067669 RepID=A0A2N5XR51_9HYPH|nr:helix-turn-helix domain-containing protein [Cohaesibacter celericrescens]PLW76979.1 chromosomal replication initiator DnaA [Cohaesibacter celericrescens]